MRKKKSKDENTPGYCRICGAENTKYIHFIEEYRCKCCFNDMFY